MKSEYPITFYNAIWLVFFCKLVLFTWSWWLFIPLFLTCPMWTHLRNWYDEREVIKKRVNEHLTDALK